MGDLRPKHFELAAVAFRVAFLIAHRNILKPRAEELKPRAEAPISLEVFLPLIST